MATKVFVPRVESLARSGIDQIPTEYVHPESERYHLGDALEVEEKSVEGPQKPIIDIKMFDNDDEAVRRQCIKEMLSLAVNWGIMHIVGHGTLVELIDRFHEDGKQFFYLPLEEKEKYANDQSSGIIQGYGSK